MSHPLSSLGSVRYKELPKTPARAYREATAEVVAYRVGVVLKIIWEVTKPIVSWTLFIAGAMILGVLYFLVKVILDGLRP